MDEISETLKTVKDNFKSNHFAEFSIDVDDNSDQNIEYITSNWCEILEAMKRVDIMKILSIIPAAIRLNRLPEVYQELSQVSEVLWEEVEKREIEAAQNRETEYMESENGD